MKRLSPLLVVLLSCTSGLDLSKGRNYPCAADAGDAQCPSGFVCGLEGRCHGVDAPGAWACDSDRYCATAKGWHCDSVARACADASAELVTQTNPAQVARISPAVPITDRFAYSGNFGAYYLLGPDSFDAGIVSEDDTPLAYHYAFASQGRVTSVIGVEPFLSTSKWFSQPVDAPPGGLNDVAAAYFFAFAANDQGVWTREVRMHPQPWEKIADGFSPSRLFQLYEAPTDVGDVIVAVDGAKYALIDAKSRKATEIDTFPDDAHPVAFTTRSDNGNDYVFAFTDKGVYVTRRLPLGTDGGAPPLPSWIAVNIPGYGHAACGAAPLSTPLDIRGEFSGDDFLLTLVTQEPGTAASAPYVRAVTVTPPSGAIIPCTGMAAKLGTSGSLCAVGQTFSGLADWTYDSEYAAWCTDGAKTTLEDVTALADGGLSRKPHDTEDVCIGPLDRPVHVAGSRRNNVWQSDDGFLWSNGWDYASLTDFLHTPVDRVVGGGAGPLYAQVKIPACFDVDNPGEPATFAYLYSEGMGLVGIHSAGGDEALGICAGVENAPGLIVAATRHPTRVTFSTNELNWPTPIEIQITDLEDALTPIYESRNPDFFFETPLGNAATKPYVMLAGVEPLNLPQNPCQSGSQVRIAASTYRGQDSKTRVIVTVGDTLFVGPLGPRAASLDGGYPLAYPRHVISPRLDIEQLVTVTPNPDAGEVAAGYALGGQRVFRLQAFSDIRWKSSELELPAGEPLAIWSAGSVGRVGFKSGVVLSLPSRVPLVSALPEPVTGFGSACGVGYALSGEKLYRLESATDGELSGHWVELPIPWDSPPSITPTMKRGRLHSSRGGLYVFSDQGYVAKVTGDCP